MQTSAGARQDASPSAGRSKGLVGTVDSGDHVFSLKKAATLSSNGLLLCTVWAREQ